MALFQRAIESLPASRVEKFPGINLERMQVGSVFSKLIISAKLLVHQKISRFTLVDTPGLSKRLLFSHTHPLYNPILLISDHFNP